MGEAEGKSRFQRRCSDMESTAGYGSAQSIAFFQECPETIQGGSENNSLKKIVLCLCKLTHFVILCH